METNCLSSSESIKIDPEFETKPSGPIFPMFIKGEIKPEADVEVDNESYTNAKEVDSLDRSSQGNKTEEETGDNEELLLRAKCESVQVQLENVYTERCLDLADLTNLSNVLPGNYSNTVYVIKNTKCFSRSQDIVDNSHKELGIVDSKASLNTACYDKTIEHDYNKHNNHMLTLHNEKWSSESSNDMFLVSEVQKQVQTGHKCDVYEAQSEISNIITQSGEKPNKRDKSRTSFTNSSFLKQHIRMKSHKCDVCEARFATSSHLLQHKRKHTGEKPYKCDMCGASFNVSANLRRHKTMHTGEKPHKCDVCEARFGNYSHLIEHKRRHTGEKPYKCDVCGASFAISSSLKRHKISHTNEKPFRCDVCEASFVLNSHLIGHKRTHTGEKPYKCDVCGAAYTVSANLKRHKRKHVDEKPHKCKFCGATFANNNHLIEHKKRHTGKNPYECDVCGASFTLGSSLKRHKGKHTDEKL